MSSARLGIYLGRSSASAVAISTGRSPAILERHQAVRKPEQSIADYVNAVASPFSPAYRNAEVMVALSPAFLACSIIERVPFVGESRLELAKGSLAESHCTGETLEELAIDAVVHAVKERTSLVEIVAIKHASLAEIRNAIASVLPESRILCVTSLTSVLQGAIKTRPSAFWFNSAGEAVILGTGDNPPARPFPLAASDPSGRDRVRAERARVLREQSDTPVLQDQELTALAVGRSKLDVPVEFLIAAAAATCNLSHIPNLIRGAHDAPKSIAMKARSHLLMAGCAAAILLFGVGYYFSVEAARYEGATKACADLERKLWQSYFPAQRFHADKLLSEVKRAADEYKRLEKVNQVSSALKLWGELGSVMPSPDSIGMTLDSVTLTTDGGRIEGHVARGNDDPLANAALLEKALNSSQNVAARGEFETKGSDVAVRIRLDYLAGNNKHGAQSR